MDDKVYNRAVQYGFAIPQHEIAEKVRLEDDRRFEAELKQLIFFCVACGKKHGLNKDVLDMLAKQKTIGRIGFTSFCPETEIQLDICLNARGQNNFSTPSYEIKKENVKIVALSRHKLVFESEDFRNLSIEQLNKIIAYHRDEKTSYSETIKRKALEELQLRQFEEPKPEIEPSQKTEKPKGVLARLKRKLS